jgi:hypothetical protein
VTEIVSPYLKDLILFRRLATERWYALPACHA